MARGGVRLRAAPHLIRLGGGVSYGSGAYFGQTVNNLTNALRELQDIEAMRKLAEGDPETYLAYWKERSKTVTGSLKDRMAGYASQAEQRIKVDAEDAKAVADYARTNNHQKYMEYLLGKLQTETNPDRAAKIAGQVDTLRTRVFRAGAGGTLSGGVSKGALTDARVQYEKVSGQAFAYVRDHGGISENDPNAPVDLKRLRDAAMNLQNLNEKIVNDSGAPSTARLQAASETSTGPKATMNIVYEVKKASDTQQLHTAKDRNGISFDPDGNSAFLNKVASTESPAGKAKLLAERASDAMALAAGLHTEQSKTDLTSASSRWQSEAVKNIVAVDQKTTRAPAESEAKIVKDYSDYSTQMIKAGVTPVSLPLFKHAIDSSNDPTTFMTKIKMPEDIQTGSTGYSQVDLDHLKAWESSGNPAVYDSSSHSWRGAGEKIKDATVADDAARTIFSIPGNIYVGTNVMNPGEMSPQDRMNFLYGVETGRISGAGESNAQTPRQRNPQTASDRNQVQQHGAQERQDQTGTTNFGNQERADMAVPPAQEAGGAAPAATSGGPKPESMSLGTQDTGPVEPGSNQDFSAVVQQLDESMQQRDISELPDWTPPEASQADFNESFPYSLPKQTTTSGGDVVT